MEGVDWHIRCLLSGSAGPWWAQQFSKFCSVADRPFIALALCAQQEQHDVPWRVLQRHVAEVRTVGVYVSCSAQVDSLEPHMTGVEGRPEASQWYIINNTLYYTDYPKCTFLRQDHKTLFIFHYS